jgi:NADPH2:quinone reductase
MRALQIRRHAAISKLTVSEVPCPPVGPGQVRVEIEAAAINPSDVLSVEGSFPNSPLPRIVGRDFAGRVVEGSAELMGAAVWGSGGDLGITRDGTHAEYIVVPRDAVAIRPRTLSAEEAAATGVPFITAWSALFDLARLQSGEWVVVSGAAGSVGRAAVQLASARNARVIALVKDAEERAQVTRQRVAAIAQSDRANLAEVVREATTGAGCAVALNGVGGIIFPALLDALADGGRMVVYAAASGRDITLELRAFFRRHLTLYGLNTAIIDAVQGAQILRQVAPLFDAGALLPPAIAERYPLSHAAYAYERVAGGASGKVVLIPDQR